MFPRWFTFLTEVDGRSLNETNGVVSSSNARVPLNPTGDLGDIKIGWERDKDLIGIIRNFSFPVSLYRTAAKIARNEFYKKNIERRLFFILAKIFLDYNPATRPATYKRGWQALYKGEVDLTSVKDGDFKITFNLLDGGTAQQLSAKKDTVYELPMDDPEAILVKMDGIDIAYGAEMLLLQELYSASAFPNSSGHSSDFLTYTNISLEDKRLALAVHDVFKTPAGSNLSSDLNYFLEATADVSFNYHFRLKALVSKVAPGSPISGSGSVQVLLKKQDGSTVSTLLNQSIAGTDAIWNIDIDTTISINLSKGDKLFLLTDIVVLGSNVSAGMLVYESQTDITYTAKADPTYIKAFLPSTVNKKLVQAMTGSADKGSSSLIAANNNLALSCINAVRSLPGSVMKTKYSDFFMFCKVQMVAGLGIENEKIVIEDVGHFYNTGEVEDLGQVKDLEISVDKDSMANTFSIGYEEQNYDDVNGKYEFNNTHLYESSITKVVKKYELICPYRADGFGIEILRTNLDGKTTTDNDSDNDVCILDIDLANPQNDPEIGTYYNLRRVVYDNFNDPDDFGVPSPTTVFNVEIRPEKILEKHRKWIDSMMYGFEGDKLVYRTTEKNTIKTKLGSTVIDGKSDYVIAKNRNFIPRLLSFDTDIDADVVRRMQTNPNRCFRITDTDGTQYTGFIAKIGVEPDSLKEQPFALLSTNDNNFLNRVR